MATFLLWNTAGKKRKKDKNVRNLDSLIQALVREHSIDILLLVEYYPSVVKSTLSTLLIDDGLVKRNTSERFGVFSRMSYGLNCVPAPGLGDRVEIWNWIPDANKAARFALVHGLDRMHSDDGTRRVFFRRIVDAIRNQESNSHRHSMIVGDFNANPFESAILSSDGLHAIGIRGKGQVLPRKLSAF